MNRIAAFALVAVSIVAPTVAHAESGAPATQERRIVEAPTKEGWIRILPATTNLMPAPIAAPGMSFGVRFDGDAFKPTPAATAPKLMANVPGIPLVVFKF